MLFLILIAPFAGQVLYLRLRFGVGWNFKLLKVVFGPVGIYGSVFRPLSDMYDIPDVTETEEKGWNVCNDIPTVSYYVETAEPFADIAVQTAVHHARAPEPVAVNIVRDIGAVVNAVLVAQKGKRRSVRISHDYDALKIHIEDLLFQAIPCGFPYPQKTAVNVPSVFHFPIRFCGKIEIVFPIYNSVAVLEKDI